VEQAVEQAVEQDIPTELDPEPEEFEAPFEPENIPEPEEAPDPKELPEGDPAASEEAIPLAADPIPLGGGEEASLVTSQGLSIQITPAQKTGRAPPEPTPTLDKDLKSLMRSATAAHGEGELERAIEAYTDLLDQADEHIPALLARGRCHLEKKDFSAAISDFRRAHKADEGSPAALVALGDLHFARRDHPQAIDYFDQAIALESDHAQARCRRGMAHYHSGRYRQAFLDLQRAYKLDPEIPNIRRLVQMAIRKLEENS
jgi:tetratricopeptide (TPR) repeat protein